MRDHYFNARWFDWAPKHEPVHGGELAHQHRNSGGTKNSRTSSPTASGQRERSNDWAVVIVRAKAGGEVAAYHRKG